VRAAVQGRENEFAGLIVLGVGVLLGLAMYLDVAGPLGRWAESFLGWFVGLGRFLLPLALVAVGVALVKKGHSSSPVRLALGWGLMFLALLGFLHVIRTPESLTTFTSDDGGYALGDGGGWIGAAIGGPTSALLASAGAIALFAAVFVGGALLITQTSLRTMAEHTGGFVASVIRPVGRGARKALSDLSTLSSERTGSDKAGRDGEDGHGAGPTVAGEPMSTALYDGAEDDAHIFTESKAPAKRRRRKAAAQPSLPIDGEQVGEWVLPALSFLKQAGQQAVNMAEIERRGETLQESLSSHNVETELIGMTVGPTVTRYELELGPGVKVARITSLQ
jgi:S-DNA-T family DNA segregation ATPase FtsK/SpoIIIE